MSAELENAAVELCAEASKIALDAFGHRLSVRLKDGGEPVTDVDVRIEQGLVAEIGRRFPEHAVIGEETGESGSSEWQWVLDPLDGTRNFVRGIPIFGVSVAVLHLGRPVAAAISLPALGEMYSAAEGLGSRHDGQPIRASAAVDLDAGLMSFSGRDSYHEFEELEPLRLSLGRSLWLGSAAAEFAWLASGSVDYAVFAELPVWDVAAGVLLVREAGGTVLAHDGSWQPVRDLGADWRRPLLCGAPLVSRLAQTVRPAPDPWRKT
ncbi:inositol monophosphatase [Lentzea sp. PSKA42]|uniref:inositol-phosphate phosphatase n=1 Tax=Lentzea indica TaxID=2604800 RepID=A0ABX1FRN9_9PSEU|nr:inositol monophosphatase [Lentzea indica]NKE61688.1 inositol monophosphatase [Lentzea indica]